MSNLLSLLKDAWNFREDDDDDTDKLGVVAIGRRGDRIIAELEALYTRVAVLEAENARLLAVVAAQEKGGTR